MDTPGTWPRRPAQSRGDQLDTFSAHNTRVTKITGVDLPFAGSVDGGAAVATRLHQQDVSPLAHVEEPMHYLSNLPPSRNPYLTHRRGA